MRTHRESESLEIQIGPTVATSTPIGFELQAAGMLFIPAGFPHKTLQVHASANNKNFVPVVDAQFDVKPGTAVALPMHVIGAQKLCITGSAKSTATAHFSRKS